MCAQCLACGPCSWRLVPPGARARGQRRRRRRLPPPPSSDGSSLAPRAAPARPHTRRNPRNTCLPLRLPIYLAARGQPPLHTCGRGQHEPAAARGPHRHAARLPPHTEARGMYTAGGGMAAPNAGARMRLAAINTRGRWPKSHHRAEPPWGRAPPQLATASLGPNNHLKRQPPTTVRTLLVYRVRSSAGSTPAWQGRAGAAQGLHSHPAHQPPHARTQAAPRRAAALPAAARAASSPRRQPNAAAPGRAGGRRAASTAALPAGPPSPRWRRSNQPGRPPPGHLLAPSRPPPGPLQATSWPRAINGPPLANSTCTPQRPVLQTIPPHHLTTSTPQPPAPAPARQAPSPCSACPPRCP
jgi:hypothetical protein